MERGKIVIVYSNKGGVGKTFIARAIADYYDHLGQSWAGFDADHSSGKFWQFYKERVITVDLRKPESLGQIISTAQINESVALLDVPAAHGEELIAWLNHSGLLRRRSLVVVVICLVITAERDTVEFAVDVRQELGGNVIWIVIKNLVRGIHCFSYEVSKVRRTLRKSGATEIELPSLFHITEEALKAKTLPFCDALARGGLNLTSRHRLFVWREGAFANLGQAKEVLCNRST